MGFRLLLWVKDCLLRCEQRDLARQTKVHPSVMTHDVMWQVGNLKRSLFPHKPSCRDQMWSRVGVYVVGLEEGPSGKQQLWRERIWVPTRKVCRHLRFWVIQLYFPTCFSCRPPVFCLFGFLYFSILPAPPPKSRQRAREKGESLKSVDYFMRNS